MSCKKLSEWFVYIVKCSDETFYTGVSTDVEKRVKTHNTGKGAKYTKTRRPVELLWTKKVSSKSEALKLEYKIKQLNRKQKIQMINGPADGFRLDTTNVDEKVRLFSGSPNE